MFNTLKVPLRALLVAVALGGAAPAAHATTWLSNRTTARDTTRAADPQPGDADMGVVWIVLGLLVVVFFVWLCARVGDNRPSDGVMG